MAPRLAYVPVPRNAPARQAERERLGRELASTGRPRARALLSIERRRVVIAEALSR